MSKIIMYCTRFCPYCIQADHLLTRKGIEIQKIDVDGKPELWDQMEKITGANTVPQIYIGDEHIGGFDDLMELEMEDELDALLEPILDAQKT